MKTFLILLSVVFFSATAQAQSDNNLASQIHKILSDCAYYEVNEEMFNILSDDPRLQNEEMMTYLKKISYLIYVECEDDKKDFYEVSSNNIDLKGFKILMRSKNGDEQFTFYRKRKNEVNEYLLIHNGGLSYIITSLNISTIQELSGIMNMIGELGT